MHATLTNPPRTPFRFDIFYHAMLGLIGREPDRRVLLGEEGFYDFIYFPEGNEEKKFIEAVCSLRSWLDIFDVTFSRSDCMFKENDSVFGKHLRVTIQHPVSKTRN